MGVMACQRKGCPHIMCDKYSRNYGYICNKCYEELLVSILPIADFMASESAILSNRKQELESEFFDC
jgi:hypothetical protein